MRVDRGLVLAAALPIVICLGPWAGLVLLAALALGLIPNAEYFDAEERKFVEPRLGHLLNRWFC